MTKKQILKYIKETDFDIQSANASMFPVFLFFSVYANSEIIHGVNFSPVFSYFNFQRLDSFFEMVKEEHMYRLSEKIYLDYLKNNHSLDAKINEHQRLTKKLDKIWAEYLIKKKKGLKKKNWLGIYRKLIKTSKQWWYYGVIGEDKGRMIDFKVVPHFEKKYKLGEDRAREIVSILSHPQERSVFNLARRDFLKICLGVINKKNIDRKIATYWQVPQI